MDQRKQFIQEMLKQERPFKHLCQAYGISENTGYRWRERFMQEGSRGLENRSRAPHHSPAGLPESVLLEIIRLKHQPLHGDPRRFEQSTSGCTAPSNCRQKAVSNEYWTRQE
jgi:transposase-like protein